MTCWYCSDQLTGIYPVWAVPALLHTKECWPKRARKLTSLINFSIWFWAFLEGWNHSILKYHWLKTITSFRPKKYCTILHLQEKYTKNFSQLNFLNHVTKNDCLPAVKTYFDYFICENEIFQQLRSTKRFKIIVKTYTTKFWLYWKGKKVLFFLFNFLSPRCILSVLLHIWKLIKLI